MALSGETLRAEVRELVGGGAGIADAEDLSAKRTGFMGREGKCSGPS